MKKAIVALVLFAAAGFASAQSNVQVYGVVDAGISKQTGKPTKIDSGIQSDSRIGIKGTEDLGGGTKAVFVLEGGVNVDTGESTTNTLFGRQAYIGLSNTKLGTVKIGRQYTPVYTALLELDPFATGLAGDVSRQVPYKQSMSNSVSYTAPAVISGLTGTVAYGFTEGTNKDNHSQIGATATYVAGPATATVAFSNVSDGAKIAVVGGSYDLTVVKVHALVASNKGVDLNTGVDTNARNYLIGVSKNVGKGTVIADVIRKIDHAVENQNATQVAVGYTYPLSVRTNLYTSYAHTTQVGINDNMVNAGIRHSF